jgi:hypothetical protein
MPRVTVMEGLRRWAHTLTLLDTPPRACEEEEEELENDDELWKPPGPPKLEKEEL